MKSRPLLTLVLILSLLTSVTAQPPSPTATKFAGRVNAFNPMAQPDVKRLVAGGSLRLGNELPPGDYVLQVIVADKLAKADHRLATQWIDFEIVK